MQTVPITWLAFCDATSSETRLRVSALLDACGVRGVARGAEGAKFGILVLAVLDAVSLELLRGASTETTVMALWVGPKALSSAECWAVLNAGAADVLRWCALPTGAEEVSRKLQRWGRLERALESASVKSFLAGASAAGREMVRGAVDAAAFTRASVLITGESGTGKEHLARLIHELDPRPDKGELVVVDCTTLSPELAGSELFGHERGSFTGATAPREGAFALAHRGTLFLDEVGELSPALQAQLLRVVQERQFKRVGSNSWQTTEFRLICATHRDLEQGVASGTFRSDFFHRIAGWRCRTVPLRERREDILPLAQRFIRELLPGAGEVRLDASVREFLLGHDYPGNVRELRQIIQRMVHRHGGLGQFTIGDIPFQDRKPDHVSVGAWPDRSLRSAVQVALDLGISMKEIGQAATELAVEMALEREGGNLQQAALRLGVTDRALQLRRASQRSAN
jgi:transcriptional regulator with GAF, ATPase, and Fis domain